MPAKTHRRARPSDERPAPLLNVQIVEPDQDERARLPKALRDRVWLALTGYEAARGFYPEGIADAPQIAKVLQALLATIDQSDRELRKKALGKLAAAARKALGETAGDRTKGGRSPDQLQAAAKLEETIGSSLKRGDVASTMARKFRELLGHSTVLMTERYAHLRPDSFGPRERARVTVDLTAPTGKIISIGTAAEVPSGAAWVQPPEAVVEKAG